MAVPYLNRTADFTISDLAVTGKPRLSYNCKELLSELRAQVPNLKDSLECLVWLSNTSVRATFRTPAHMENFLNLGVSFRKHPLVAKPSSSRKRVTILRLAYGIPHEDIVKALAPYGSVSSSRVDEYLPPRRLRFRL